MSSASKIVAINGRFENMAAFLAHIAEDAAAVGFIGAVIRETSDGGIELCHANFKATREQSALAGAMLLHQSVKDEAPQ